MQEPLISLKKIEKIYQMPGDQGLKIQALQGIDLEILPGEFVAIMGPSGSGKSTLLQILGLLDRPSSGDFQFNGHKIHELDDDEITTLRSRTIGFVFQFFNLLPRTTSTDNVSLPMIYAGFKDVQKKAHALLQKVFLGERLFHKPHQLSGGQQQRVAIARALANNPSIILADEPTGNISSQQADEILKMLSDLNDQGITVILVTHEPEVAEKARRLINIKDGNIAEDRLLRDRVAKTISYSNSKISRENLKPKQGLAWLNESIKMATTALSLNILRTSLATLGIIIGIASFTTMMAIGEGATREFAQQMSQLGTNVLNIRATSGKLAKGLSASYKRLNLEDFHAITEYSKMRPEIKKTDAQVYLNVVLANGAKNSLSELVGATPAIETMQNFVPIAGRFFTDEENLSRARVALLGPTVVKNLFNENENPIGRIIKINQNEYTVIGVLKSKGGSAFKDRDDMVLIPLETAIYRIQGLIRIGVISIQVNNSNQIELATEGIKDFMRKRNHLGPEDGDNFEILDMSDVRKVFNDSVRIITSMLQAIAMICLLVGGIGIMNVMFVSVKERTREVGLRKALGARRLNILSQFLVESIMIGLMGGVFGIILGFILSQACNYILGWKSFISFGAFFLSLGFSLFVGVIFGLWPARQAASLSPIEALRYE